MINIPYYVRKRIIDYMIHFVMIALLIVTLFPIGWMIYTSLKENTDILVGKIPLSHAHNNTIDINVDKDKLWILTSDGGINKLDRAKLKELDHATAQTSNTHFLTDKKYIWVSSANHGLLRYDKDNLKSKKEFKLNLPPYDESKVVGTTLASSGGKIYFAMQYKGLEKMVEFDQNAQKIARVINVKSRYSPAQVRSLLPYNGKLYVGLDKGLLQVNLSDLKIEREIDVLTKLPLGVERMKAVESKIVMSGINGAYILDPQSGVIAQKIFPTAVLGMGVNGSKIFIGNNRGFYSLDFKTGESLNPEMLFKQVRRDGTVIRDSSLTPAEVLTFAFRNNNVYIGSTFGRVSNFDLNSKKVVSSMSARQGHLVISWVNYIDMWKNVDFGLYLRNSFFICGIAMLFSMLFATMAAYALSRFDFPGSKMLSMAILATQMVPGIMFLIPIYSNFVKFSEITGIPIKGTYWGLIFVYSAFFIPFSIWILRGFFAAIPVELEEAARIDGCSPWQVFWHVVLPLAVPGIIATGIYVFLTAWDELIFAWVLTSGDTMTVPVGIRNFVGNYQNRFDLIMAAAVVATVPVMILFFLLQKHIVKGLTAGAVKG